MKRGREQTGDTRLETCYTRIDMQFCSIHSQCLQTATLLPDQTPLLAVPDSSLVPSGNHNVRERENECKLSSAK